MHIQKTGGSSVSKHLLGANINAYWFLAKHATALDAKERLANDYQEYFTFAFVRNPWDRLVSWYNMIRIQGPKDPTNRFWSYILSNSSCFEEFIKNCTETVFQHDSGKSIMRNQIDYMSDSKSNIIVDEIGRFETLTEDLHRILNRLLIPFDSLPVENALPHAHYSTYYTDETREIVATRFKRDIEYFGYRYEAC